MLNFIVFGPPGSGKGTSCKILKDMMGFAHVSTGDVIRDEIRSGTELGRKAREYTDKGFLLPDEVVLQMLIAQYDALPEDCKGVMLDGFPRTIAQAQALEQLLAERNQKITAVLGLEVSEDILMARLLRRAVLEDRPDDNEETIRNRFKVYREQTKPLVDYFTEKGLYKAFFSEKEVSREERATEIAEHIEALL